ncbi:otolith matrix protein OMM-64-like [Littorina saxatilis]|uniref:Uncharacterized protein n=1 Tax=Littorina saxatilis TaxID=31220 RepID=A0AAN9FWP5_9CAEN
MKVTGKAGGGRCTSLDVPLATLTILLSISIAGNKAAHVIESELALVSENQNALGVTGVSGLKKDVDNPQGKIAADRKSRSLALQGDEESFGQTVDNTAGVSPSRAQRSAAGKLQHRDSPRIARRRRLISKRSSVSGDVSPVPAASLSSSPDQRRAKRDSAVVSMLPASHRSVAAQRGAFRETGKAGRQQPSLQRETGPQTASLRLARASPAVRRATQDHRQRRDADLGNHQSPPDPLPYRRRRQADDNDDDATGGGSADHGNGEAEAGDGDSYPQSGGDLTDADLSNQHSPPDPLPDRGRRQADDNDDDATGGGSADRGNGEAEAGDGDSYPQSGGDLTDADLSNQHSPPDPLPDRGRRQADDNDDDGDSSGDVDDAEEGDADDSGGDADDTDDDDPADDGGIDDFDDSTDFAMLRKKRGTDVSEDTVKAGAKLDDSLDSDDPLTHTSLSDAQQGSLADHNADGGAKDAGSDSGVNDTDDNNNNRNDNDAVDSSNGRDNGSDPLKLKEKRASGSSQTEEHRAKDSTAVVGARQHTSAFSHRRYPRQSDDQNGDVDGGDGGADNRDADGNGNDPIESNDGGGDGDEFADQGGLRKKRKGDLGQNLTDPRFDNARRRRQADVVQDIISADDELDDADDSDDIDDNADDDDEDVIDLAMFRKKREIEGGHKTQISVQHRTAHSDATKFVSSSKPGSRQNTPVDSDNTRISSASTSNKAVSDTVHKDGTDTTKRAPGDKQLDSLEQLLWSNPQRFSNGQHDARQAATHPASTEVEGREEEVIVSDMDVLLNDLIDTDELDTVVDESITFKRKRSVAGRDKQRPPHGRLALAPPMEKEGHRR